MKEDLCASYSHLIDIFNLPFKPHSTIFNLLDVIALMTMVFF